MERRHSASHIDHFEHHGWVLIERLLSEQEIDVAYPGLFALYPTPEEFQAAAPGDVQQAAVRLVPQIARSRRSLLLQGPLATVSGSTATGKLDYTNGWA